MPKLTRRRWLTLGAAAAVSALGPGTKSKASLAATDIVPHASGYEGFYANTYLFESDEACLLIDAHLNEHEALSLSKLVRQTDKPLDAIVVTHPHPDHYLGLEHLAPLFPGTDIHSSEGTLEFIRGRVSTTHSCRYRRGRLRLPVRSLIASCCRMPKALPQPFFSTLMRAF